MAHGRTNILLIAIAATAAVAEALAPFKSLFAPRLGHQVTLDDPPRRLDAVADSCPAAMDGCATSCFLRKCKLSRRFNDPAKCVGDDLEWCRIDDNGVYNATCADYVAGCGTPHPEGACYESRCKEGTRFDTPEECSAKAEHFWCGAVATEEPTFNPTAAPTPNGTCDDPDAFMSLARTTCQESTLYDNVTAGVFDCTQTLESDDGDRDDFMPYEDNSGWYAMQWEVDNQWLSYDFGYKAQIGSVCIRWDDFKNVTYGALSVRVDTSLDGTSWDEGSTIYDESNGLPQHDLDKDILRNKTLDDLCFNVEEMTTRHLRIWMFNSTDPEELWLGVARVGFKCGNAPTAAPTAAPSYAPTSTFLPTSAPTEQHCRPDELITPACVSDSGHFLEDDPAHADAWACWRTTDGTTVGPRTEYAWWTNEYETTGTWLLYDLGANFTVGQVCIRWGQTGGEMYGATAVRVDHGFDPAAMTEGETYTPATGGFEHPTTWPGLDTLEDACFDVTAFDGRYVKLFFNETAEADWLGVNEVGFRCEFVEPSIAPTMAPTGQPSFSPSAAPAFLPTLAPVVSPTQAPSSDVVCPPTAHECEEPCFEVICQDKRRYPHKCLSKGFEWFEARDYTNEFPFTRPITRTRRCES